MATELQTQMKSAARVLARELEALGYGKVQHTHLLMALAKVGGFGSWNAVAASAPPPPVGNPNLPYPAWARVATYAACGITVDIVNRVIADESETGFYLHDQETGLCLNPGDPFPCDDREIPTREAVDDHLTALQMGGYHCPGCDYVCMEEECSLEADPVVRGCPSCGAHMSRIEQVHLLKR